MNTDILRTLACRAALLLYLGLCQSVFAAGVPDPAGLITVAELEAIVGRISAGPKTVDATLEGGIAAEFTVASDESWVTFTVYPADRSDFDDAMRALRTPDARPLPEFGKDAFLIPSFADVATDLYLRKGGVFLEVSIAKGEGAVEKLKAIAKIVLPRL